MLETPLDLIAPLADRQLDWWLVHYTVVNALKPIIEKAALILPTLCRVVRVHVSSCLDTKFFIFGGCAHESFGIAAEVKRHARPVADGKQRDRDLVPLRLRAAKSTGVEIIGLRALTTV